MMRKLLFVLTLGFSMSAMGQVLNVTSIDKVNLPDKAAVAAISPQGDYLLLTSATNQGLTKLDLTSGQSQTLSTAPSAGHNVKISPDGQTVVYREGSWNNKHLRLSSLKSVNLATGASEVLVSPRATFRAMPLMPPALVPSTRANSAKRPLAQPRLRTCPCSLLTRAN